VILGVSHLCFRVTDLDATLAFYTDVLGFKHAFDFTRDDGSRFGAYISCGNRTFIEFFARGEDGQPAHEAPSYQHVCLEVDDMTDTVAALREAGAEVSDPTVGKDGNPQAWLSDPDGNRIELHELRPDGWQLQALARLEGRGA